MRSGRKSEAQTKAPIKDRIKGSEVNKKGSASSTSRANSIVLSNEIIEALTKKADDFNQENKKNKVSLNTLKAVFRRGAGAFSTSHRPNMTRNGWAYARVNKFLEKKAGKEVKKAYIQDDDLMEKGGSVGQEITCHNCGWQWNTKDSDESDKYVCHKCGFDNTLFYSNEIMGKGGQVPNKEFFKWYLNWYKNDANKNMSIFFSLPSELTKISSNSDSDIILDVFEKNNDNVNAKKYLQNITDNADKYGVTIYLKPIPRIHKIKSDEHKKKITKDYLIQYYNNFGFKQDKNDFMVRQPKMSKGGLIAPNGNPSNLTPEQYKLVRTPQFKAWFGDWENDPQNASKVVDDNGEPMVVYHGTNYGRFNVFDNEKTIDKTFYFTKNKSYAIRYSYDNPNFGKPTINSYVFEVFLNLRNPLIGYSTDFKNYGNNDGAILTDDRYLVLNSNQIKLADGTNTTFDMKNPDIRYKEGGQLSIDDNGLMDSIFPEVRDAFKKHGLKLEKNYAFTDGYNKMYLPYTGIQKTDGRIDKVAITYYEDGFEILGEIEVEVEDNGSIEIEMDFPNWQIKEEKSIYASGGHIDMLHEKLKEDMLNNSFKSHKDIEQIAEEKGVELDYAKEQLRKGMQTESEHSNDPMVQEIIALQHLDEMIDYYQKLEYMETTKMEKGGQIDPDNKKTKDMITHKAGNAGGLLVGNRHSEGGIKAVNKSTNSPLEMEGGEVVITRNAVSDNEKREFEGQMLTNREILSKINESGGGVSFEDGGKVDYDCECDDDEMANGGMVTLYDDYDKGAGYIIEKGNKYWTGKNWSDVKAYAESYKTKKEAEQKLKSTKMADGGDLKNIDPKSLIGKMLVGKIRHSEIINAEDIGNDNIWVTHESFVGGLVSEENFTKDELLQMSNGKEVRGEVIRSKKSTKMADGGMAKKMYVVFFNRMRNGKNIPHIIEMYETEKEAKEYVESRNNLGEKGWKIKEAKDMPIYSMINIVNQTKNKDLSNLLHSKEKVDAFFNGKDSFYKKDYAWVKPYGYTWENWKLVYAPKMAVGGELDWGADLGDGFSIGNDVYIIDTKSLYKDKTGYVSGLVGKDLLVTISINGDERNVVVSKKGVERLDAPEFAKGGNVNSDLSDKELKDLVERLSKEKTLDKKEEYALMKAKYMLNKRGNSSKYDDGGKLDTHSELKQFFQEQNTPIVVEEPIVEEIIEEEVVELPTEIMLYKEDLTSSDDFPMIYVGSSIYANNTNGSDEWVVKSFSNDGVNLLHIPSNPLAYKHEDKNITFDELTKLFKNNAISIKFVLNERELNLILMIIKDKLQHTQSFKVGGVVMADEDGADDEEIMKSQFGNKKF